MRVKRSILSMASLSALAAATAWGQDRLAFEVASIRPAAPLTVDSARPMSA